MATYKLDNQYANFAGHWLANTVYALGKRVMAESANVGDARKYVFECTTAGTSQDPGPPTWDTTPGNTTNDGTVVWTCREATAWTNAHGRLDWLFLRAVAGDTIHIDDSHNESYAAPHTLTSPGTAGNPVKIICVDKADDSTSSGALIQTTTSGDHVYLNAFTYCYGVKFKVNGYFVIQHLGSGGKWTLEGPSSFEVVEFVGSTNRIQVGDADNEPAVLEILGARLNFPFVGNFINLTQSHNFIWRGGLLVAPSGVTKLFDGDATRGFRLARVEDVDLSAVGANALVDVGDLSGNFIDFLRCKLAAGVSITTGAWIGPSSGRVRAHHCSSGANTYEYYESCYEGTLEDETTIVRNGGASDGTTSHSMKMVSTANAIEYIQSLMSRAIHGWNAITGSSVTFTVYIYNATADLDDDEVWLELEYPANDGGLGTIVFDRAGCGANYNTRDPQATPAAQTDDASTWNGSANFSQKLEVTVTPGLAGPVTARVFLAKPSTTIYVDPVIYMS